MTSPAFADVASLEQLPLGSLLGVTLPDGTSLCLFNDRGVIGAVGNLCPHAEFPMSDGVLQIGRAHV